MLNAILDYLAGHVLKGQGMHVVPMEKAHLRKFSVIRK